MSKCEEPAHYPLTCSGAKRWINCPGSKYLNDDDEGCFEADFGTMCHDLLSSPTKPYADNEFYRSLTREQQDRAIDLMTWAWGYVKPLTDTGYVQQELKLKSSLISSHGGTMDVLVINAQHARIIDYKFGRVWVSAKGNEQLLAYANLVREHYPEIETFTLDIVQPRYRMVDSVTVSEREVYEFYVKALEAGDPLNMELNADPDWCIYCPALAMCKEAAKLIYEHRDMKDIPANPTAEDIATVEFNLKVFKMAEKGKKQATETLKKWADQGHAMTEHRVVKTKKYEWDDATKGRLREEYGHEAMGPRTPLQVAKAYDLDIEDMEGVKVTETSKLMAGKRQEPLDPEAIFNPVEDLNNE